MSNERIIEYRKDVDGLRSIAVLFVLIFHFDLLSLGKGGFLGVDVFFVISGFLITSIILKQLRNETFSFKEFYLKRIRRLAPALFAVLILVMVVGGIILLPSDYTELSKQLLATQLYFSNFYFWQNINYFGLHADSTAMLHTWSLAVEEQYYLLFPMAVYLIFRYQRNCFWYWMLSGMLLSFSLNLLFVGIKPEFTFYLMPTRGWELLCGGMVVWLLEKAIFRSRLILEILGITGISLIFLSVLSYNQEISFPGYFALFPVSGAMLLILTGQHQGLLTSRLLSLNIFVYIGKLSYSLYLVHWPIHIFASEIIQEEYGILWRIGMFGLSFLISMLLFHAIENPVRKGYFLNGGPKIFIYYFGALSVSLLLFFIIIKTEGLPARYPKKVLEYEQYANNQSPPSKDCAYKNKTKYETDDFCPIGDPQVQPSWVVYGDSHAWAIKGAIDLWLKQKGEAGLFMFRHGCLPLKGIDVFKSKGQCLQFNDNIYDYLYRADGIKNVLIVSTWLQAAEGILTKDFNSKLSMRESLALFNAQFSGTMEYLKGLGKGIYLWAPVPGAKGNVPNSRSRFERVNLSVLPDLPRADLFFTCQWIKSGMSRGFNRNKLKSCCF